MARAGGRRWRRRLSLPEAVMRRYAVRLALSDDSEDARASEPAPSPPPTGSEWSTARSSSSQSSTMPPNDGGHSRGNLEVLDSAGRTSSSGPEANPRVPELPAVIACKPRSTGASQAGDRSSSLTASCPSSRASVGCQSGEPSTTLSSSFRTAVNASGEDEPRNCCAKREVISSPASAAPLAAHDGDSFLAECVRFLERSGRGTEPLTPTSGCSTSNPRSKSSSSNGYRQFPDRPATPSSSSYASVQTVANVQRAGDTSSVCSKRHSGQDASGNGRDSADPCATFTCFSSGSGCVSRTDKAVSADALAEVGGGCDVVAGSSYCEGERAQVCVARYSALPRSVSMLVNVSSAEASTSDDDSESGLSLVDSLEDTQLRAFFVPVAGSGPRPATERALALSLPRSLHRKLSERRRQLIERQRRCREQQKLAATLPDKRNAKPPPKHVHKNPTLSLPDINQPRRSCRRLSPLVHNECARKGESNRAEANWKSTSVASLPQGRQPATDNDGTDKIGAASEIQNQDKRHNCAATFLPPPRQRLDAKTSHRDSAKVIRRHSCINNVSASPKPKPTTARRPDSIQKIKRANNETPKPVPVDTSTSERDTPVVIPTAKREAPILETLVPLEPLEPNVTDEENVPLLIPDNSYNQRDEKTGGKFQPTDLTSRCKRDTNSVNGTDKVQNLVPLENTRDRTNCPKPLLKSAVPAKPLLKSAVPVKKWTSAMYGKKVADSEAVARPASRKPSRLPVRKLSRLLPPAPSPSNMLSSTYCHRFEVIPEERSASLESSNEDTIRNVADRSRTSSLCNKITKKELDSIEAYKGKAALSNENDLLSISKGWINFYLLKEHRLEDTNIDERGGRPLRPAAVPPTAVPPAPSPSPVPAAAAAAAPPPAPAVESSPAYSSDSAPSPPAAPARRRTRARPQPAPLPRPASPACPATGWSVTVAANLEQCEELEMRLSFPACVHSAVTSQSDSGVGEENTGCLVATPQPPPPPPPPPHQPRFTLTLRSRAQRTVNHITELPPADKRQFQYFPDVNNTTGLNKSSKKSTKAGDILLPITTHSGDEMKRERRLSVQWPDLQRSNSIIRKRTAYPSTRLQTLTVKGCAITPERKSHFRSASERDLSRAFAT